MKIKQIAKSVTAALLVAAALPVFAKGSENQPKTNDNDVVILYTNDIHCGINGKIGYSGLVAYRNQTLTQTPYVLTVDNGDAIQGEAIGSISKGSYVIDIMNESSYDLAILGNHEFDYGMPQLENLIAKAKFTYINTNVTYDGKNKTSFVDQTVPYVIKEFGSVKIGFIGLCTPTSITTSTPTYFMENNKIVYDFNDGKKGKKLYKITQKYVDQCYKEGADYVIALSHLGDEGVPEAVSSKALIANTSGINVVLDGHAHSVIPSEVLKNKKGQDVILTSTGTKFEYLGKLTLSKDGKFTSELIDQSFKGKDKKIQDYINSIMSAYNDDLKKVVATSDVALSIADENGIRLVRTRELPIGNLCADAYRSISKSDIAFVNGGGIRTDLPKGDIAFEDILKVHPYGNTLTMVEASGQQVLDALEYSVHRMQAETSADGKALGEFGGFLQVSGIKFTVDLSIPSGVVTDDKNMFVKVKGERRVKDVYVFKDDKWVPLNAKKTYTVASHNYMILNYGDGYTMFKDNKRLIDRSMSDYQVLMTYLVDVLKGKPSAQYSESQGRITIK
ncbi:bifunctional UDP-sugar hydrolase/5'-nucleotidase [Treponema sp.]|uniref:bifunctional metallophosphatase/5'-nucleotidase n=1 Tax=Treponema sp. TaxID=166 RepID=UPI0025F994F2|nr:bifunctional UDP-sugar hydrolase/5'-nucleotidase [Treponema sp.]MCR5217741.1 bifunctional metallophosphatase/5'-nucleotidase [Treponema sp.]